MQLEMKDENEMPNRVSNRSITTRGEDGLNINIFDADLRRTAFEEGESVKVITYDDRIVIQGDNDE